MNSINLTGYPFAITYKRLQVFSFGFVSGLFLMNYEGELRIAASYKQA